MSYKIWIHGSSVVIENKSRGRYPPECFTRVDKSTFLVTILPFTVVFQAAIFLYCTPENNNFRGFFYLDLNFNNRKIFPGNFF